MRARTFLPIPTNKRGIECRGTGRREESGKRSSFHCINGVVAGSFAGTCKGHGLSTCCCVWVSKSLSINCMMGPTYHRIGTWQQSSGVLHHQHQPMVPSQAFKQSIFTNQCLLLCRKTTTGCCWASECKQRGGSVSTSRTTPGAGNGHRKNAADNTRAFS